MILVKAGILTYPRKENVNKQGTVNSEEMLVSDKKTDKMLPVLFKKQNQGLGDVISEIICIERGVDCPSPPQLV